MIEFIIPIQGLESGQHRFEYNVGKKFFDYFGNSIIEDGEFQVQVIMDRRTDMILCDFLMEGHMITPCDRCLETIKLPIRNELRLMFKFAEELREEDMIVFIPAGLAELNLGHYIYEMLSLSAPLVKTYDCENDEEAPCNEEILSRFKEEESISEEEIPKDNPFKDILKGLKDN